ncbi:3-oxoadipate enol-lactonase [Streptomyces sp. SAI-135]|uniref:alpha/beta fold hydrolase n=1 Tax=unclassified Streptomyces TaxID=2593676 RepID=UPI002476FB99|nr:MULTISPECIES: alpha/beta fold hydrolase [unclassified Streptomyces]MDH6523194.1 3-oxoadipate enol-lactonase [Streptomyces sp. SAI-090]MDH6554806.1 3-oxoadipate enol-lactonase [Streptomyces sp. SAI-041]MDH6574078.1 3-oxoadipate enol-lactonase [Streptomyces sp. SAI-117]MDH6581186.1 3-oxoadipate enol-lactonase [Streptomyces sp. SAI-133]MDH6613193.1 3-oxoadipate enol-lactonase [Streptomyces sp. SAI-135]
MAADPSAPPELSEYVRSVNGIELHVTEAGSGAPLLMLHGVGVDASAQRREIEALARSHRVIAPDLRGHGRSTRPAAFSLRDHVDDMIGLLDDLGLARTAVLGGSMGSYVAQALALAVPQRVSELILVVATSHGRTSSTDRVLAEHADELRGLSREQQQQWLSARLFAPETPTSVRDQVRDWYVSRYGLGLALSPEQIEAANKAVLGFDFRADLATLEIPTLLISGRHDILNPPAEAEQMARLLPSARLEVFEHSGHLPSLEEPERFDSTVLAFLSEHTAVS